MVLLRISLFMFFVLSFLWFIRTTKAILFWFYLWQLKEYHIGRFLAHFQTEKGKRLFLNKIVFIKIFLLLSALLAIYISFLEHPLGAFILWAFFPILLLLYFFEFLKTVKDFFQKKLKKPVLTKKTSLLIIIGLLIEVLILFILFLYIKPIRLFVLGLLIFDILTPVISSVIVLLFQPIAALWRWQVIQKAKRKREKFRDLLVIGITGSYGKTSTKEFLAEILSEKYNVLKTKEHQNSEVGISQCILNDLKPEHQIFVVEMGAYNRGGIKLLADICKPKIGILTGINEQHLATFGSLENIIKTKFELIESLPEDGIAFFNGKNKYCRELYKKTKIKKFLYGEKVKLAGFENIKGSRAVAKELGMSEEEIERACQKIKDKFPGIEKKKGISSFEILDATYSANPDGVLAHLEYLKTFPGKKVVVMPCLIELGSAASKIHRKIGKRIAEVCDLAIITTKDRFREIKKSAIKSGLPEGNILFLENPKEIFEKIKSFCKRGDVVLLESRVPKEVIEWLSK